jgi:hypothetical protein
MKRHDIYVGTSADYVELRSRLKMHLTHYLQSHLVKPGQANEDMEAGHLGRELGL